MKQVLRVSLPGYDAVTDTNPDHFALYTDEDWVLIKEKKRDTITVPNATTVPIKHGLKYVPMVFGYAQIGGDRVFLSGGDLTGTYNFKMWADKTNIYFRNSSGQSSVVVKYYIFYDSQSSGIPDSVPLEGQVIAVTKFGYDVLTETNPNNFIFRSDLNTFKILSTGIDTFTVTANSTETKTIPHSVWYGSIPAVIGFTRKVGSTKVMGPSQFQLGILTDNYKFFSVWANNNGVNFELRNDSSSNMDIICRYLTFEVP